MYLLDTNHCSRLLAGDPAVTGRFAAVGAGAVTTCVIVRGELVFMAERSAHVAVNLRQVEDLCMRLVVYDVDEPTADWYGSLKAKLLDRFGPHDPAKRRTATLAAIGVSDNDLWIAAIAKRQGCILVSHDRDFASIAAVTDLTVETWWTPPPPSPHDRPPS